MHPCVSMFIRISMSMNESSSKLRIKVYYFLFGSLLFSADLYNNFLHPSPLLLRTEPIRPYPLSPISMSFKSRRLDCLRIVASLQFEFLRDLHKSFRPHNSTEITVYSVSLVVCIFSKLLYSIYHREIYNLFTYPRGNERNREETK